MCVCVWCRNTSTWRDLAVVWMWQTGCFATSSCGVRLNSFYVSVITDVLLCWKVIICEVHHELWRVRHNACFFNHQGEVGPSIFSLDVLCFFSPPHLCSFLITVCWRMKLRCLQLCNIMAASLNYRSKQTINMSQGVKEVCILLSVNCV